MVFLVQNLDIRLMICLPYFPLTIIEVGAAVFMPNDIYLKYRTWFKGTPPRQIKLEVPGWSGDKNWDVGQAWHCKPYNDGSTYGLELLYPFDTECTVSTK